MIKINESVIPQSPEKQQMKNRVYVAAPFFDSINDTISGQESRIEELTEILAANSSVGYVYSPKDHQSTAQPMFGYEWRKDTFQSDVRHVLNSDVVVALMAYNENGSMDDGVAFEVGLAFANGIPVVFVGQDHQDLPTNLMLSESGTAYFDDTLSLLAYNFNELTPFNYTGNVL